MTYDEIKRTLREAGRLVDAGKVGEGDALIRTMLGKGMTPHDLRVNLSDEQYSALRKFERSRRAS